MSIARANAHYALAKETGDDMAGGAKKACVEDAKAVDYDTEPARSDWQRVKVRLLSLLPLDMEL